MLNKLWNYLNPMAHVGEKAYPLKFPFFTTISVYLFLEIFGYFIWKHPDQIGNMIIFSNFALVLYFSFRSTIKGGLIVVGFSILYYIYFLFTRHAPLSTKENAAVVAALLTITNLLIVLIVGWHRKSLDNLLDREIQAKLTADHERKRWQALMEQLPVGVIIAKAPTGKIITRNEEAIKLFSDIPNPITSSKDYGKIHAYKNGQKIRAKDWPLAQALSEGKTITGEEIILQYKKMYKVLFVNAAPIHDNNASVIAAVTTFYDITKQKELERQKDDFMAMVSHELKTPLTSAKIYAQAAIATCKEDERTAKLVRRMNDQLDKLSTLVTTMLDTTRMEQGKLVLKEEPFVLKTIAIETIADLQETLDCKITLDWQTQEYVFGNKERVVQIFTNLITNAVKFSSKDSEIIIRSQKKDELVIVSVQDFGVGLSPDEKKHIFDRFYQSKDHKTYPGLGLGLYLSNEIVKRFGGEMWVESEKGKGSTFYFSLPIYKEKN